MKASFPHKALTEGKGCLSCHGNHTAKYQKLLLEKGSDLCFTCHEETKEAQTTKDNIHAPFAEGKCSICHDPHGSNHYGMNKKRMDSLCYECHPDTEVKFIKTNTHEPVISGQCNACHVSHTAKQEKLLISDADDPKLCINCHGELMKVSVDGSNHPLFKTGKCRTCHDVHGSNIAGMIVEEATSLCVSCHKEDPGEKGSTIESRHEPFTAGECTKCHSPHKAALDSLVLAGYPELCLTCHETLKAEMYKEAECAAAELREEKGMPAIPTFVTCDNIKIYVHAPIDLENCSNCHMPHFSEEPALINKPVQDLCAECHDFEAPSFNEAHIYIDPKVIDCRKCHDPHTSKDPKFFKDEVHPLFKTRSCENCHMVEKP